MSAYPPHIRSDRARRAYDAEQAAKLAAERQAETAHDIATDAEIAAIIDAADEGADEVLDDQREANRRHFAREVEQAQKRDDRARALALSLERVARAEAERILKIRLRNNRGRDRGKPVPVFTPAPKPKSIVAALTGMLSYFLVPLGLMRRPVKIVLPENFSERMQALYEREMADSEPRITEKAIMSETLSKEFANGVKKRAKDYLGHEAAYDLIAEAIMKPNEINDVEWFFLQEICNDLGPYLQLPESAQLRDDFDRLTAKMHTRVAAERIMPRLLREATGTYRAQMERALENALEPEPARSGDDDGRALTPEARDPFAR